MSVQTLSGKVAIVTGGAGALGAVLVGKLLASGAAVAIPLHRDGLLPAPLRDVPSDRLLAASADLTQESQVSAFVASVLGRWQRVDILVNAAGGYAGGRVVEEVSMSEWESMMSSNLQTAFLMSRAVLPAMRAQGFGRIISIAAMGGLSPGARRAPYQIAKRGVVTLTESIAEEVKGTGVTANAIAPSIILTEANKASMPGGDFSRWVRPEDIGALILYLCSREAGAISGNAIKIYGGV